MICLLRLPALFSLIIIIGVISSDFTDQQPTAPRPNDISGTVHGCANAILQNDDDDDGAIRRDEFLDFVNHVADLLCLPPRPILDLELQSVFVSIACLCQEMEGNEINCCFGESAGLFVSGANSSTAVGVKRSEEGESYLRAACLLTQAVLGPEQCAPEISNTTSGIVVDSGEIVNPELVATPCTKEYCANDNIDEGYHFCGVDGKCHNYSCHNFYRYFDPALTGYRNTDGAFTTLSFECFGYNQGGMENAVGVAYACNPQFPFTLASYNTVIQPFNRKCTADQGLGSIFECYEFVPSETATDFYLFLAESESSFLDCVDGEVPTYYSLVSSSNHYEGFEGLQGNPIVAAGADLDGDTIWQGQEGSSSFDRNVAMTAMYANVVLPRPTQSETNQTIAGTLGENNPLKEPRPTQSETNQTIAGTPGGNNSLKEPSAAGNDTNIFDHASNNNNAGADIDWTAFLETLRDCGADCDADKIQTMVEAQNESDSSATATSKQAWTMELTPTLLELCRAVADTIELMVTLEYCTVASTRQDTQHNNTDNNTMMNDTITTTASPPASSGKTTRSLPLGVLAVAFISMGLFLGIA